MGGGDPQAGAGYRLKDVKLFVIVDAFLDRSQQAVQASHAVAAFCLQWPDSARRWGNQNIVLKKAKDLHAWAREADATFREPHWKDQLTACAAYREEGYAAELPFV